MYYIIIFYVGTYNINNNDGFRFYTEVFLERGDIVYRG